LLHFVLIFKFILIYLFIFLLGKEVGRVSKGDKNVPTRAPNCHLHRLPPTLFILFKKEENNMYKRGE